jgi:hypothetical protein
MVKLMSSHYFSLITHHHYCSTFESDIESSQEDHYCISTLSSQFVHYQEPQESKHQALSNNILDAGIDGWMSG